MQGEAVAPAEHSAAPSLARWELRVARHESVAALLGSALLVWLAQFHHLVDFGLYEDDYFFIARAMGQDLSYLVGRLAVFWTLPQGRPFGFFLPDLLSFVGDRSGGLTGIYLLGFGVVTLNTFLCYRLLRTRVPAAAALVGAAVFALFPADTTRILLTHDFQLQPALTFTLLAALAYMAGRGSLAYVVGTGALLSYESAYLALFALPLFARQWDRRLIRELVRHTLILVAIVVLAVGARFLVGEVRATQSVSGVGDIVPRLVGSLALGPLRSVGATLYQPVRALPTWNAEALMLALSVLAVVGLTLWRLSTCLSVTRWREVAEVAGAGVAMLVLGYGLAFTHYPPNAVIGRGTSVHLGATLGVAVLGAAVAWGLLAARARVATVLLASYLALAAAYYVTIERDFMRSWQIQRAFWQQVAACCSDLQDGTVLIYELPEAMPTSFIFTNSWADPLVLDETFRFPRDWKVAPRLFSLTEWHPRVVASGTRLDWWVPGAAWDEHWEELPQGNVILLRAADGGPRIERLTGTIELAGQTLQLKDPAPPTAWPPGQLYQPLLK